MGRIAILELAIVSFTETLYQKVYQFVRTTLIALLIFFIVWYACFTFYDLSILDSYILTISRLATILVIIMLLMFVIKKPYSIVGKFVFYEDGVYISSHRELIDFSDLMRLTVKYYSYKQEIEYSLGSGVKFEAGVANTIEVILRTKRIKLNFLLENSIQADQLSTLMIKLYRSQRNIAYYQGGERVL